MKNIYRYRVLFTFLFFGALAGIHGQGVLINEIVSSNSSVYHDETGSYEDWIELYNPGLHPVDLSGYYVTDDPQNIHKYRLPEASPALVIPPLGYLILWASGNEERGDAHLNFRLSAEGEYFSIADGTTMEITDSITLPPIPRDVSYGRRLSNASEWAFFTEPTPLTANYSRSYSGLLDAPVFSHSPGLYAESFDLKIWHDDPEVIIRYSLNGSEPDEESPVWNGAMFLTDRTNEDNYFTNIPTNFIPSGNVLGFTPPSGAVMKAHPIRAKAFKGDLVPSEITGTYFIFAEGEAIFDMPVFSIITEEDNLFSDAEGIYVPGVYYEEQDDGTGNYYQRGIDWERSVHLEMFELGELRLSQGAGVRIHGGWSRRFPQKSLRLYARNQYGASSFEHDLFNNGNYNSYRRFLLRNSGNDINLSFIRDATAQRLIRHLQMEDQDYRPSVVFINGEYWGIHNIRERQDRHYLHRRYGIEEDELDLLSNEMEVQEGDDSHYRAMMEYIENNDLSDVSNYDKVHEYMDLENYLNYYSVQVYCANNDWPHNNVDYWRKKVDFDPAQPAGHDGRWRWMVYDIDRSFGYFSNASTNMMPWITHPTGNGRGAWATALFRNLLENEKFQQNFINRISDHLNSCFLPEVVVSVINQYADNISTEMSRHIHRWNSPGNINVWHNECNKMRGFAASRPVNLRRHLMQHFNIDTANLHIKVSSHQYGYVRINSLHLTTETPGVGNLTEGWNGTYFKDVPVHLAAIAYPGFIFSHWMINGQRINEQEISWTPTGTDDIIAVFEEEEEYLPFPEPYIPDTCPFYFLKWDAHSTLGKFPEHMTFVYMSEADPGISAEIDSVTRGVYNLDSRTRVSGLGDRGVSFINTGNETGNRGYPGTRLGGAMLGLRTDDVDTLTLFWTGRTITANSRKYAIRLQYRIGDSGSFTDVKNEEGRIIEFRGEQTGRDSIFGPIKLPDEMLGYRYVQLFWRYYFIGEGTGPRDELAIDDLIIVRGVHDNMDSLLALKPDPHIQVTPVCEGQPGEIMVDTGGNEQNLEFSWSHDPELNYPIASILTSDIYFLTISAEGGCSESYTIVVPESEWFLKDLESKPACAGQENGAVVLKFSATPHPVSIAIAGKEPIKTDTIITQWDFNQGVPSASPSPSKGDGEAYLIGGVINLNTETYGAGSSDIDASENLAWQTSNYPAQYSSPSTAGVQFKVNTTGFKNIRFTFDQRLSNTSANTWSVQVCENILDNDPEWSEAGIFHIISQHTGTGDTWHNKRHIDLRQHTDLENNPNVGIRIVSEFDPNTGQYEAAQWPLDYAGGTSRFDMVTISGDPVMNEIEVSDLSSGLLTVVMEDNLNCVQNLEVEVETVFFTETQLIAADTASMDKLQMVVAYPVTGVSEIIWNITGGHIVIDRGDTIDIQWEAPGTGLIEVEILYENGCQSYDFKLITITDIETAIDEPLKLNSIEVFPNPFNNQLFIKTGNEENMEVQLFDMLGTNIVTNKFPSKLIENYIIDTPLLFPGMYILIVKTEKDILFSRVLLKQ